MVLGFGVYQNHWAYCMLILINRHGIAVRRVVVSQDRRQRRCFSELQWAARVVEDHSVNLPPRYGTGETYFRLPFIDNECLGSGIVNATHYLQQHYFSS